MRHSLFLGSFRRWRIRFTKKECLGLSSKQTWIGHSCGVSVVDRLGAKASQDGAGSASKCERVWPRRPTSEGPQHPHRYSFDLRMWKRTTSVLDTIFDNSYDQISAQERQ